MMNWPTFVRSQLEAAKVRKNVFYLFKKPFSIRIYEVQSSQNQLNLPLMAKRKICVHRNGKEKNEQRREAKNRNYLFIFYFKSMRRFFLCAVVIFGSNRVNYAK